jgi:hypothetical protein
MGTLRVLEAVRLLGMRVRFVSIKHLPVSFMDWFKNSSE